MNPFGRTLVVVTALAFVGGCGPNLRGAKNAGKNSDLRCKAGSCSRTRDERPVNHDEFVSDARIALPQSAALSPRMKCPAVNKPACTDPKYREQGTNIGIVLWSFTIGVLGGTEGSCVANHKLDLLNMSLVQFEKTGPSCKMPGKQLSATRSHEPEFTNIHQKFVVQDARQLTDFGVTQAESYNLKLYRSSDSLDWSIEKIVAQTELGEMLMCTEFERIPRPGGGDSRISKRTVLDAGPCMVDESNEDASAF